MLGMWKGRMHDMSTLNGLYYMKWTHIWDIKTFGKILSENLAF